MLFSYDVEWKFAAAFGDDPFLLIISIESSKSTFFLLFAMQSKKTEVNKYFSGIIWQKNTHTVPSEDSFWWICLTIDDWIGDANVEFITSDEWRGSSRWH